MRRRVFTGAGLAAGMGAVIVMVGVGGAMATPAAKTTKVHCTSKSYNVSSPSTSGTTFATLKCSKPFGAGVQQGTFAESIAGTKISVTGKFKNFYDSGTNHGSYKLSGTVASGPITATGSVKVTGGTGAYKNMTGTGKLTCTTTDAGKTYNCTTSGTLKS